MSDRIRVSLDATAVPASPAGAGRYIVELARALAHRGDLELVLLVRRADAARWRPMVTDGTTQLWPASPEPRPLRLAWEQVRLPALLARAAPELHHGPHYTLPVRARLPLVATVHDCTFFDHPEWHERTKAPFFRRAIRTAARRAASVVCVSNVTAERLRQLCEVRGEVFVAPHGVDHARFTPVEPESGGDERTLRTLGIDPSRPYVLFVGTIEPRKNVPGLLRAFDALTAERPELVLVIAGSEGWASGEVARALGASSHAGRVHRTGYVPDPAVPALLRRAAVVAYPSFIEGYGLPALEALACGAPLVTTTGTAMAEVAGRAALLVEPGDDDALAGALATAVDRVDPDSAEERRMLGLEVAAARTWEASAETHVAAYRHAVAAGSGRARPGHAGR